MKTRLILNLLIVLSFGLCYTQWGTHHSAYLGQMEWHLLFGSLRSSENWAHPIIWGGLLGQFSILIASFEIPYRKPLHLLATIILSIVPILLLLTGLLSKQYKMLFSTLPFFLFVFIYYFWPNVQPEK